MPQPRPPQQGNFFRRLTSKIRSSSSSSPNAPSQSQSSRAAPQRKGTVLRIPKAPPPAPPPNDFTSAEQRQAALRARGLIPASSSAPRRFRDAEGFMMPLSEQEAEIDRRYTVVVPRISYEEEDAHTSEARRIREAWLAKQDGAAAPSSVPRADARASGGADASGETAPRTSDAVRTRGDAFPRHGRDQHRWRELEPAAASEPSRRDRGRLPYRTQQPCEGR
ncbi:hypothetical protein C8T65DRAFT_268003 [Cerioporus squamosus]|nr:hypothetical protein C8T65DRAFT_268003 [Cerioporus squamosus]